VISDQNFQKNPTALGNQLHLHKVMWKSMPNMFTNKKRDINDWQQKQ